MSHDEHGAVEEVDREHGPEWWAMGSEFCTCEHHYDVHGSEGRCQVEDCTCEDWGALDKH